VMGLDPDRAIRGLAAVPGLRVHALRVRVPKAGGLHGLGEFQPSHSETTRMSSPFKLTRYFYAIRKGSQDPK